MLSVNPSFNLLQSNYLFADIARKVAAFREAHPDRRVISLGIGDVSRPLSPAVITALHKAVDEMGTAAGFHGYGPEQGYAFLREAIAAQDYATRGVHLDADEIFISDGAKCDVGNFQELLARECVVAVMDPVYPVYVDSNVMAGRAGEMTDRGWSGLVYLPCTRDNDFVPDFPAVRPDIIYLCYPNNPTGTVLGREALAEWVAYARREGCLILYDSAYEAFIREENVPHSIYEIDGAREVAVEFRSYSKTAGFTGLRCAYTVVPRDVRIPDGRGGSLSLNALWNRRQCTKYNGCPYIVQRAAEATHSEQGRREARETIDAYLANGARIAEAVRGMGLEVYGGMNAPYLWVRVPGGMTSWGFFDHLLQKAALVCTPGAGFGLNGEGYVRLTAFGSPDDTTEAIERLRSF
ncbi:LL-diaminopimelate aminotransferase [uncultured Desulfovibrio sp.]|uniref:LL-diaminopimelate aminotransferase n=1 Tax=Candidatus Desulfovibrio intestinavium TaxID=2838534 RepID=A0A9D2HP55_9BACT|nr:LL-diaminopimelate aminotransferase [uncultured Desulfovibrio sp.]HJA79630.1 LL-diaminopimelate aminotransferase [Candidatus Desulfovibrio intestinavium]